MPRRSVEHVRATREALLRHSVDVASVHGLDGLSFGQIAADVQLSKSGLAGHFASKTAWQLAVIDQARTMFREAVVLPGREGVDAATSPIVSTCRAWIAYLEQPVFAGGCFFTAVATEFDSREGPVREAIRVAFADMRAYLVALLAEEGRAEDAEQLAFEILATMQYLNHCLRLDTDPGAVARARRSLTAMLGREV